jgi:hypothetical protein
VSRVGEVVRQPKPDDDETLSTLDELRRSHKRSADMYQKTAATDDPERARNGRRPDWQVDNGR